MEKNFIAKLRNISTRLNGSESISESIQSNFQPNQAKAENGAEAPISQELPDLIESAQEPDEAKTRRRFGLGRFLGGSGSPKKRKPFYRSYLFWIAIVAAGSGGTLAWGYWTVEKSLPNTSDIFSFVRDGTLTIKSSDGTVLQQLGPATRDKLSFQQIPPKVVNAFLAAEDRRFYQHTGVDYQSIIRATTSNLLARDVVEGASTITQQVARLVYLNQDRTFWRKMQEAFLARKIERELSKQQILEKYLNLVYLGSGAYGVADAAWVYFSKPVDKLTLSEMATIAGLPPAPSDYSPLVNPKSAQDRRNIVLDRMEEEGFITAQEAEQARSQPLNLKPSLPKKLYSDTPYFTSYIQQELPKYVSKEQLEIGGITVETTLNIKWQIVADKVVKEAVKTAGPAEGFEQAALVAIDSENGEIRAMVGGTDFLNSQFNRVVQAQRQPGSSFKPILYTTAIATGMSPYDTYLDAPYKIDGYEPQNFGKKNSGWMSLRDALTNSVNVVSVRLLVDVGFDPVIKMAHDMGIKSKLMPTYSLALGASEVNLLELANAYATLAAQGQHTEAHGIRRILNRKGEVIYNAEYKPKQVVDKVTTAIVTWMMQNVVNSGTGRAAQLDREVAGKTGTSEQARDLWFIGFIPQLVTGVWLGNDDSSPTWSYSSTAASIWHDFMVAVVKDIPVKKFPELPPLEGRKGSIKAQKVTGAQVSSGKALNSENTSENRSTRPSERSSGAPTGETPRRESDPSQEPQPPAASTPAVKEKEPVPPPAPEPPPPAPGGTTTPSQPLPPEAAPPSPLAPVKPKDN